MIEHLKTPYISFSCKFEKTIFNVICVTSNYWVLNNSSLISEYNYCTYAYSETKGCFLPIKSVEFLISTLFKVQTGMKSFVKYICFELVDTSSRNTTMDFETLSISVELISQNVSDSTMYVTNRAWQENTASAEIQRLSCVIATMAKVEG